MSTSPDFDLEKLFLPAWAQESPTANRYEHHPGEKPGREGSFGDRPGGARRGGPRRDGPRPAGGGGGGGSGFGGGPGRDQSRGPRPQGAGGPSGPRPAGGGGRPGGPGGRRDDRGGGGFRGRSDDRRDMRPAPLPLPELNVSLMPDEKGVESLSRQIKMSGRSFPLFDIAHMILQKPERQQVRFEARKKADGTIPQYLYVCAVDDSLWLSEQEAVEHVLSKHFGMFYQAEKLPTDPPKGTYTFVAQCGISGVVLGPPNHHDYQNQLHKLHQERFSRMAFDAFKARVKIVREEAVVKKWVEDQSFKTEYVCLNVPEALRITSYDAVLTHFREVHQPNIIKQVEKYTLSGPASRNLRSPGLQRLVRHAAEEQKRFPLQIATVLSQQFAGHGLQFFKVNKTITHVSVARPHFLDLEVTPVSAQVKSIVEFINSHPKCTRKLLVETMSPTPAAAPAATVIPVAPVETPAAEGSAPAATAPAAPAAPQPTAAQAAIIGDLHWLIHQGHVIEFANGILETAKKPLPKPVRPPKEKAPKVEKTEGAPEAAAEAGAEATTDAAAAEVTADHVESAHSETAPEAQPAPAADTGDVPPAAS